MILKLQSVYSSLTFVNHVSHSFRCRSASQHQFWVPAEVEEEVENEELVAESRSRYISFPGSFVPVSHFCRAPLGDGKLCQRQDRFKVTG